MPPKRDFEFGILEVANLLGLKRREKIYGRSVDVCCPLCGDEKYHLNLNLQKNAYRCNRCGESGGMLQLYGAVKNISNKDAYKEILEYLRLADKSSITAIQTEVKNGMENNESEGSEPNFELIHRVYTSLFEEITLLPAHKKNLMQRGLPEGVIVANSYRSIPDKSKEYEVAEKIMAKCSLTDLYGVPGFYMDKNNKWKANFPLSGFLIPVRNFDGRIEGAQIRSDSGTPKYFAFSSSYKKGGTKSTSAVHCVGRFKDFPKTVYITEGPLKADIAHFYTGYPFLAIQGVNNQKYLDVVFSELKSMGVTKISECFDMDKRTKVEVQKAVDKVKEKAIKHGFSFSSTAWNSNFKGIDDYLANKYSPLVANM